MTTPNTHNTHLREELDEGGVLEVERHGLRRVPPLLRRGRLDGPQRGGGVEHEGLQTHEDRGDGPPVLV